MNKLISFVKEFTKEEIPELRKVEKIQRGYFYIEPELKDERKKIDLTPFSEGLFFGELIDNRFKPGFPLLDILSKHSTRKAVVNNKGETLFLFKNNILEESIVSLTEETGYVLVENEKGEVLGYGDVRQDKGKKIIKNVLNRSDFLKREN